MPMVQLSDDVLYARALEVVLKHEGKFSNDPNDPGGATNYGISLRLARRLGDLDGDGELDLDLDDDGDVDIDDIRLLTPEKAGVVYRHVWWDRYGYGRLHLTLAVKVFDLAVNMGAKQSHRCTQRALRACGYTLAEDGVLGPKTLSAILGVRPELLVIPLRSEAAGFYRGLVARRPASEKYLAGWLNRAYA